MGGSVTSKASPSSLTMLSSLLAGNSRSAEGGLKVSVRWSAGLLAGSMHGRSASVSQIYIGLFAYIMVHPENIISPIVKIANYNNFNSVNLF